MRIITAFSLALVIPFFAPFNSLKAQQTRFEKSGGKQTATYYETISFYRSVAKASPQVALDSVGTTDAGFPLHVVLVAEGTTSVAQWQKQNRIILLVNNGIHAGEPDGIDASMMLVRNIANGKLKLPPNVALAIIPLYNIGGALNRNSFSRVNQNGPEEYGFRGNAQNLDLNRDFIKADSKNAQSFQQIFHWLKPHLFIDNHVSDGADFQHTFTLLTTQYDKLGEPTGTWLRSNFEPALYKSMKEKGWDVFPYVNFDSYDLTRGMTQFYDAPRYSNGYAALFGTIGFVPETHMLKPYNDRVRSTYDFMEVMLKNASKHASSLLENRRAWNLNLADSKQMPLRWVTDKTKADTIVFRGYLRDTITSEVTGMPAMRYNRQKPFDAAISFYNYSKPDTLINVPKLYYLPQGWQTVIDHLKRNGVQMRRFEKDSMVLVDVFMIDDYKTSPRVFEKHYRHSDVKGHFEKRSIAFRKGDYIISSRQDAKRYLFETLYPTGDDGFFAWNFFDAVLQQKEGYSDYRWEELAAGFLKQNPSLKEELEAKKKAEPAFAKNSSAQLYWVYQHSPWFEKEFMRYPVFFSF